MLIPAHSRFACTATIRRYAPCLVLLAVSCEPKAIQVTTTADGGSGSLRAAIDAANSAGSSGARIELPSGNYDLTRCGADDTNVNGDLDITTGAPVTLVATGPNVVIHQTCAGERVLHVLGSGLFTLTGVTITGGNVKDEAGGGLLVRGDADISQSSIHDNSAAFGGGLSVDGRLTIARSSVTQPSFPRD